MPGTMTWVGLDVHARSIHASAIDSLSGELTRARFGCVEDTVAWLVGLPGPVRAAYEAGPTGFGLYRQARLAGVGVEVIAPGRTPRGRSDRVKTDKRDAELLARQLLAGALTSIVVPAPEVEAARELARLHDACRRDLMDARHRVSKMLLRHGRVYPKDNTWTAEHRRWLACQQLSEPVSDLVLADLIAGVDGLAARKAAIHAKISELVSDPAWWPTISRLCAFRGIDTLSAFTIHLELSADWQRFPRAKSVPSWLGLTPSLDQSGESSRQGAITKTGSQLARRILVEAAWQYARPPRIGATLRNRQAGQPAHVLQISNRCQQRLYRVHQQMRKRGKPGNVINVAVARELACFLWAAATAP